MHLRAIFLHALRDVDSEFKPGYRSRVSGILRRHVEGQSEEYETIFREANEAALRVDGDANPVLQLEKKANLNIDKLSLRGDNNRIKLTFVEQEFTRILSNIRMVCADKGLDISTNGLGYNNLVFIATVLTELKYDELSSPHAFACLIIEEPEAHLHPQLQTLLLDFLQSEFKDIQVILTSHSPTLASAVDIDNINIMCGATTQVYSVLLQHSEIKPQHKAFLQLFLDVTRSQLFFARAVIFVEGISEAILMKALWNYCYREPSDTFDKQGIEVVNIEGVTFNPYVDLISKVFSKSRVKCVIITDDDRGSGNNCPEHQRFKRDGLVRSHSEIRAIFDDAPISSRASGLKNAITHLKSTGNLIEITLARKTLEVELGVANAHAKKRLSRLLGVPLTSTDAVEVGIELWAAVSSSDRKSEFANTFARLLKREMRLNRSSLQIPEYIKCAFEYLKNG
jgi:putative ATP-dependent endonuclease of OLD family